VGRKRAAKKRIAHNKETRKDAPHEAWPSDHKTAKSNKKPDFHIGDHIREIEQRGGDRWNGMRKLGNGSCISRDKNEVDIRKKIWDPATRERWRAKTIQLVDSK